MKIIRKIQYTFFALLFIGCTRDEVDLAPAIFPTTAEIFTDVPVGLTDQFFVSFDPAEGANTNGFGVDENEAYEGTTSIRIDVPGPFDPDGGFIGGIFEDRGEGRNLTQYNALTFWARSSISATIGTIGFGNDFKSNTYAASRNDIPVSTSWTKIVVPIPDPSKLVQERGLFLFSVGTQSTNGLGFTLWMDEIKFEKLGTIAQPLPQILGGASASIESFNGSTAAITGQGIIYNVDGDEVFVNCEHTYFNYASSDESIATVNDDGEITVLSTGSATITATFDSSDSLDARGSLAVNSIGDFSFAPEPTRDAANVISVFSDAYNNIGGISPAIFNNGEIVIDVLSVGGQQVIDYREIAFVGIGWGSTTDVSSMEFLHVDVLISEPGNAALAVEIIDHGADNTLGGSDDTAGRYTVPSNQIVRDQWVGIDIPLNGFTGNTGGGGQGNPALTNIGTIVLVAADGRRIDTFVDNIYFFRQ